MTDQIHETMLEKLAGKRVLVVGDLILDVTLYGEVDRISPEAPVPVLKAGNSVLTPGGAANVAMNVKALGAEPMLIGRIGKDRYGAILRGLLARAGISTEWLIVSEKVSTIRKTRMIARNQQILRVDHETVAPFTPDEVRRATSALREGASVAQAGVFSDYAKGVSESLGRTFISQMRRARIPFCVDPKPSCTHYFEGAYLLTPNHHEAKAISGLPFETNEEVEAHGFRLRRKLKSRYVLITRGANGMSLVSSSEVRHFPVVRREVYDVTGAGDTVAGTLASCLAAGFSLDLAIQTANLAAGVVIQKAGTATATCAEILALARGHRAKVVTVKELLAILARHRGARQRIVFTNGVFDLLHPGHIQYLQAAKRLGDVLVVAVNSDESARRLKGPQRPINPLAFRLEMLSAFQCVDYLIPFHTLTPLPLIRAIKPDILVKGGDYTPETVVGKEVVEAYGGRVAIVPYLKGYSSTELIRKIRSAGRSAE
ncbi:MAG: D-glycero-beta-D-manno-heptose 1-phosphate adenylyltransferase [bacterium JZ-2024 1]